MPFYSCLIIHSKELDFIIRVSEMVELYEYVRVISIDSTLENYVI